RSHQLDPLGREGHAADDTPQPATTRSLRRLRQGRRGPPARPPLAATSQRSQPATNRVGTGPRADEEPVVSETSKRVAELFNVAPATVVATVGCTWCCVEA